MRRALVVGINYYQHLNQLHGCVNDAHSVNSALGRHADGSVNFGVELMVASGSSDSVSRSSLRDRIQQLFEDDCEVAFFYFAGHGHIETTGGFLCASDCERGDDGVSLTDVLNFANCSKARNKIIVLDSCHSGIAGTAPNTSQLTELSDGLTILTASTETQYATEENGSGVFTTLFVDALNGAAANLVGEITPGSIYAHIDQSLGPWDQRPVFKTNVKSFVSLRTVQPPLPLSDLRKINELFALPGAEIKLDPSFEPADEGRSPGMPPPNPQNTAKFAVLQKYNRVNLVVPVGADHMWNAAMEEKSCKLTVLGEHYWRLAQKGRI